MQKHAPPKEKKGKAKEEGKMRETVEGKFAEPSLFVRVGARIPTVMLFVLLSEVSYLR